MPQSTFTSEYTPRSRGDAIESKGTTVAGREGPAANAETDSTAVTHPVANKQIILPEGPPPFASSNAPRVDLNPSISSLRVPGTTVDGEQMNIYHIDPSSLPEKPWRRPGADLSDWFNYGFDEMSWRDYGEKKRGIAAERQELMNQSPSVASGQYQSDAGIGHSNSNQDAMAMMQMKNGSNVGGMGGFNPQVMAQMPPQQQMQFMSQMMANGGMGLEAMMAPFLPNNGPNGPFGIPQMVPGMSGIFNGTGPAAGIGAFPAPNMLSPHQQPMLTNRSTTGAVNTSSSVPSQDAPSGPGQRREISTSVLSNKPADYSMLAEQGADVKDDAAVGLGLQEEREERASSKDLHTDVTLRTRPVDAAKAGDQLATADHLALGLPNPAGMAPQDMAAFLGMAGLDVNAMNSNMGPSATNGPPASNSGALSAPPQAPLGPSGRGRHSGVGVAGAPRGPAGSARGGRPGVAVPGAPTGPANMPSHSGAPTGPSRAARTGPVADRNLPANVPTGPRNPGKRYNDRDTGTGSADALDYGGGGGGSGRASLGRSESRDVDDRDSREGSVASRRTSNRPPETPPESSRLRESTEPASPRKLSSSRRSITIKGRHETIGQDEDAEETGHGRSSRPMGRSSGGASSRRESDEDASASRSRAKDRDRDRGERDRDRHGDRPRERDRDRDREERREGRRERRRGLDDGDRHRTSQSPDVSKREKDRDGDGHRERERERIREREREERSSARASRRAGRDADDVADLTSAEGSGTSEKRRRKRGASEVEGGTDDDGTGESGGNVANEGNGGRLSTRRRK